MKKKSVLSLKATIINDLGMHARPAAKIAAMAMEAKGEIRLCNGSSMVDASSIIDILTLNAVKGALIEIRAETLEDENIINDIQAFFEKGFGEIEK